MRLPLHSAQALLAKSSAYLQHVPFAMDLTFIVSGLLHRLRFGVPWAAKVAPNSSSRTSTYYCWLFYLVTSLGG